MVTCVFVSWVLGLHYNSVLLILASTGWIGTTFGANNKSRCLGGSVTVWLVFVICILLNALHSTLAGPTLMNPQPFLIPALHVSEKYIIIYDNTN